MAGPADFVAAINADNPVAFYKCQEASGTIVDSVVGGSKSLSNLFGTITYSQPGPMVTDKSIRFNVTGNAFSNQCVSFVTDNFTLGYWGKLGGGSISNGRPTFRNGSGAGAGEGFEIDVNLDGSFLYLPNAGSSGSAGANSTGVLTTSAFKLIHVVRRAGVTEYWINGVADNLNAGGTTPNPANIGDSDQLGAANELDMYIAYAFIFETALSGARILAQYQASQGSASDDPPIGFLGRGAGW